MFLNKMKEQLGPEKGGPPPSFPHPSSSSSSSSSHYPTAVLSMDMMGAGVRVVPKQEGGTGGGGVPLSAVGAHLHQPHGSQNIAMVPVSSTGIMTAGERLCCVCLCVRVCV